MRALFANYAHIMRTFIGFVLHTFGVQHRQCDIISGVYHKHVTFIYAVCRQQLRRDMSLSDWLLLSYLPVLTTATSSLWVS